jgi:4-amino-4-deoxy-L-arabinose transferase-like glycosyltransferase
MMNWKNLVRIIANNKLEILGLGIILLTSILFRFWRLTQLFVFTMDEEYEAFLIRQIIHFAHWPLIGVNAAATGLYLGPGILYLGALPYWLFQGNPIGIALLGSSIGVLTTLMVWWVARDLLGKLAGFFSGLLYAGSWLIAVYDRRFWNPSLIPILSLVIVYSLWKILKGHSSWLVVLGLGLGGVLHSHLSGLIFFPLVAAILIRNWWKHPASFRPKWLAGGIAAFILVISPLLIFDLRHDFTNSQAIIKLLNTPKLSTSFTLHSNSYSTLSRLLLVPGNHRLATQLLNCPQTNQLKATSPIGWLILGVAAVGLAVAGFKSRANRLSLFLILAPVISNGFWLTLSKYQAEYYWLPSFPWIAVFIGWGIGWLYQTSKIKYQKFFISLPFFGLLVFNFISLLETTNEFGLAQKTQVFDWLTDQIDAAPFQLESWGGCHRQEGYTYLASYYLKPPVASYTDLNFDWIYGRSQMQPVYRVDLVNIGQDESMETKDHLQSQANELKTTAVVWKNFGSISAIVNKLP